MTGQEAIEWWDASGWLIRAHLGLVDGSLQVVGVDVRSFDEHRHEDGELHRTPGPKGYQGFSYDVARLLLRPREITDRALSELVAATTPVEGVRMDEAFLAEAKTARSEAAAAQRQRPIPEGLQLVADLYAEAKAKGERKVALYVANKLRERGEDVRDVTVRNRISRAKKAGLIT
ncbi:hypothetical protein OG558_12785 [Kribbella sp. NBC_01510]|uniref:hypothetical protein n=1 Tax=Kribbella sp. NBC_01510 TaxID=2903581 RepID=UPI003863D47C